MNYRVHFKAKLEGLDKYVYVGVCDAEIALSYKDMISEATGLPWIGNSNNGKSTDVMPHIYNGLRELSCDPKYRTKYSHDEIVICRYFFGDIVTAWEDLLDGRDGIAEVSTFWIG